MTHNYHTPIPINAAADAFSFRSPMEELDAAITLLAGGPSVTSWEFATPTTLTITTGAVTLTQSLHAIDTEAAAATDDLDTINGGADGWLIMLSSVNAARVVVVRHNIGNIKLWGAANISLDDPRKRLWLIRISGTWYEVGNAAGGGGGAPVGAKYIVQEADGTLTNEQSLGLLTTGIVKNTVTAAVGVLSTAVNSDLPVMTGATAGANGASGAVPQPLAGEDDEFLRGDGTWAVPAGGGALSQCSVYTSSGQVINNTIVGVIQFANEAWDNDTMHDNATNNTRVTINTAGRYQIFAAFQRDNIGSMGSVVIQIRINGTTALATAHDTNPSAGGTTPDGGMLCMTEVDLVATDYIEMLCLPIGNNLTIAANMAKLHVRRVAS